VFFDLLYHQRDNSEARRYLDLGQVVPKTIINVRAGTVIKRNVDVLIRSALAVRRRIDEEYPASTFAAGYGELGAALELRYRRNLRFGLSGLYRRFARQDNAFTFGDNDNIPDPLPEDTGGVGESSFYEGGLITQYSGGARRFSARAEFYGRSFRYRSPYVAEDDRDLEIRFGGRFAVEGWFGSRLRLRGEYDLSSRYRKVAPELRGVKTLRVLAEATF
jgi:hypothetical protein